MPHVRLCEVTADSKSLRQLMAKKSYQLGQSLRFVVEVNDLEAGKVSLTSIGGDGKKIMSQEITVLDVVKLKGITKLEVRGDGHITAIKRTTN